MAEAASTSVDKNEVDHFNSFDNEWWWGTTKNRFNALYSFNEVRVPYIRDSLLHVTAVKEEYRNTKDLLRGLEVLEVGCGGGILSEDLARLGCNVTGVDVAEEVIKVAKHHAGLDPTLTNLSYEWSSIEDHAVNNYEKYDVVVASEVIEHTKDKRVFLEACVKCLKPGGSIFITTINKTYTAWFITIILAEYVFKIFPKGIHEYDKFISPQEMEDMFKEFNCRAVAPAQGIWYNLFRNKWSLTSNDYVFYAIQAVKD